jgi:O-antigen/teichoic acid export membrane protein
MRRDYIISFATTLLAAISYSATMRIVAFEGGAEGFGEYALVRRLLSVLAPIAILGADLATARFVAYTDASKQNTVRTYPAAGLVVLGSCLAVVSGVLLVGRADWSGLFFGSERHGSLIVVLPPLLLGVGLHSITYNYLRGLSRFIAANALMAINYVAVPILPLMSSGRPVQWVLLMTAAGWIAASSAFLLALPLSLLSLRGRVRDVLTYGLPRVPGELLQLALFAAPSVLIAHLAGIGGAGVVAFGTACLGMVASALAPISFMMLPISARLLAANRVKELRHHIVHVVGLTLAAVLAFTVAVEVFADVLINAYLGPSLVSGTETVRILAIAAIPYGLYVSLKSVVDARHMAAINSRNMVVAVIGFGSSAVALRTTLTPVRAVLISFVIGVSLLSVLTVWEAWKALSMDGGAAVGPGSGLHQTKA